MSLKLFALNFASLATAQLTTSIWFPGGSNKTIALSGSVVAKDGDNVTVSLDYKDLTEDPVFQGAPATVTVAGNTFFAYQQVLSDDITYTIDGSCTRKDDKAVPICVVSTVNYVSLMSEWCNSYAKTGVETRTLTRAYPADSEGPGSTETRTVTVTDTESTMPHICSESIGPDDSVQTITVEDDDETFMFTTYQLVLTAGTEKLSAAATPTAGGPSSTGGSNSPTGSAQSGGAAPSGGAAQSGGTTQFTGAAPMMTSAPLLAGLGAAAAAIFL
jgi:hypothetical protein